MTMRQLTSIPKSEQEHALASFWAMMKTCENQADNNADPVLKHQVAGWYQQWNRITGDSSQPVWERRAKDLGLSVTP